MKKDLYRFWAIFRYDEDGISVRFPDLPGCFSSGADADSAYRNAKEALGLHLYGMEQDNEQIPEPTHLDELLRTVEKNETLVDVQVLMAPFRDLMRNKAVKKTLTIPQWLNDLAEENKVNVSQVLQDALKQILKIEEVNIGRDQK
jgi:predicted RNase H-like HicB family nuclease